MKNKIIGVSIVASVIVVIIIFQLRKNKEDIASTIYIHDTTTPVLVEFSNLSMHTFDSEFSFLGTFDPNRTSIVGSEGQGKVLALTAQEGDRIAQGAVMLKLDDEMLRYQLENLDLSIEGQTNDEQRATTLSQSEAVPAVQLEKVKLGLKAVQIQRKQLLKQLAGMTLKAPFSGIVTKKLVDLGAVVGVGSPVFEITDVSQLKLTINVPERDIARFTINQSISIEVDAIAGKTFSGKISLVGIQADKTHNFKVQVLVSNPSLELRSGMYATASIVNSKSVSALSVPRNALVGSSKNPSVYVIRNGKAVLTPFSAGTSDGDFIEVISGLTNADRIILKGQVNLVDGSSVKSLK